jgi:hypothetical protein
MNPLFECFVKQNVSEVNSSSVLQGSWEKKYREVVPFKFLITFTFKSQGLK